MEWEESGTRSAPEEDCQSHVRARLGWPDVYMYVPSRADAMAEK